MPPWLPAVLELLKRASATLGEAGIAQLVTVHKHLAPSRQNGTANLSAARPCYALITLAMVVGTHQSRHGRRGRTILHALRGVEHVDMT